MERKEYVIGFAFDSENQGLPHHYPFDRVALVMKNRPDWQKGLLNGIGGKIEPGETPLAAMKREFEEEAGVADVAWEKFLELNGETYKIYCYRAVIDLRLVKTMTDEEILCIGLPSSPMLIGCVRNLWWLIPMAADFTMQQAVVFEETLPTRINRKQ